MIYPPEFDRWLAAETPAEKLAARKVWIGRLRRQVLNADLLPITAGDPCDYCGHPATCVDHITPLSRWGNNLPENLAKACERCNLDKLDFTLDEWKASLGCWPPPWSVA